MYEDQPFDARLYFSDMYKSVPKQNYSYTENSDRNQYKEILKILHENDRRIKYLNKLTTTENDYEAMWICKLNQKFLLSLMEICINWFFSTFFVLGLVFVTIWRISYLCCIAYQFLFLVLPTIISLLRNPPACSPSIHPIPQLFNIYIRVNADSSQSYSLFKSNFPHYTSSPAPDLP